jgi:hypothetical protein
MKQDIPQSVSRRSSHERLAVGRGFPGPPDGNSHYTAGAAWRGGGTRRSQEPVEDEVSKSKSKVRFVKLCVSGGESPPSLGGWSARSSKWKQ